MFAIHPSFDVCIVGSGIAGLTAAHKLRLAGARVAVLRPEMPSSGFKQGDYLPYPAAQILRDLKLESLFVENGIPDFSGIRSAWGTDELVSTDFVPNTSERGWLLDRWSFEKSFEEVVKREGVTFFCGKLKHGKATHEGWRVDGGNIEIAANWIIDASGRLAHFAKAQGTTRQEDMSQFAVVRWFQVQAQDRLSSPIVEAVPGGWWYTALLPKNIQVITFQGDAAVTVPMYRSTDHWFSCLNQSRHVGSNFLFSHEAAPPRLLRAGGSYLAPAGGTNWLAVGDAALTFDPISSQGIFSALYTALRAAETVISGAGIERYLNHLCSIREAYQKNVSSVYAEVHAVNRFRLAEPILCRQGG